MYIYIYYKDKISWNKVRKWMNRSIHSKKYWSEIDTVHIYIENEQKKTVRGISCDPVVSPQKRYPFEGDTGRAFVHFQPPSRRFAAHFFPSLTFESTHCWMRGASYEFGLQKPWRLWRTEPADLGSTMSKKSKEKRNHKIPQAGLGFKRWKHKC